MQNAPTVRLERSMSELPPVQDPDPNRPSEGYAAYPRAQSAIPAYGSPDKFKALADGYFGLNWVFLANVVLALAFRFLPMSINDADTALVVLLGLAFLMFCVVAGFSFPYNRKIAYGKGWADGIAVLASVLMGLNSVFCCGIIGYIIMQTIAAGEMKNYGLATSFFGITKKKVEAKLAELNSTQTHSFIP